MTIPKRHHYIPRFYLERFVDSQGLVWVFDKSGDRVFRAAPAALGVEKWFYEAPELRGTETSPLFLEAQFAQLEAEAAKITACWLRQVETGDVVVMPEVNREIMSLYIATQLLRTAEQREILAQFLRALGLYGEAGPDPDGELQNLHARLICDDVTIHDAIGALKGAIWIFARNKSEVPFYTSDHPVLLKSPDNKQWLCVPRIWDDGVQIVFPISPSLILYCKERVYWRKLERFDNCVSPVHFTAYMAEHENSGQIGMSRRFVFCCKPDFEFARTFCDLHPEIRDPNRVRISRQDSDSG